MEPSKSDISKIISLQYQKGREWNWVRENRKPSYCDFGLSERDVLIANNPSCHKEAQIRNTILKVAKVINGLVYCLIFAILAIVVFYITKKDINNIPSLTKVLLGLSPLASVMVTFSVNDFLNKRIVDLKHIDSKTKQYHEHLDLYEKWLVYKKREEDKKRERKAIQEHNAEFNFNLIFQLTTLFKKMFWKWDKNYWQEMDPLTFEQKVCELYSKNYGYEATTTKQTGDGGIDVILKKNGVVKYVQCKHYSEDNHLGAVEVRAFWGVCSADHVRGIMVCTSSLTQEAQNFIKKIGGKIEVVGLDDLVSMSQGMMPEKKQLNNKIFNNYLSDNYFFFHFHCYLSHKCYTTKIAAETQITKLIPFPNFEYKVISISDELRLDYYMIVFVESRYSYLYNYFYVNLQNAKRNRNTFIDYVKRIRSLVEKEMQSAPTYKIGNQNLIEFFTEYNNWWNKQHDLEVGDDDAMTVYKREFTFKVPKAPAYDKNTMTTSEYMNAYEYIKTKM